MVITSPLLEMEKEHFKRLRRLSNFPRAQGGWELERERSPLGPKPVPLVANLTRLSELPLPVGGSFQADSGVCRRNRGKWTEVHPLRHLNREQFPQGREQGRGWLEDAEQAMKMGTSVEWESSSWLLGKTHTVQPRSSHVTSGTLDTTCS